MTICHTILLWLTCMDTRHLWVWAHKPMDQERWLAHTLGEVHYFSKPYDSRRTSPPNIYASPPLTILSMWYLVSHIKYLQYSPSHVSHIIPETTFGSDIILGCDNSLHNFTVSHSCGHETPVGSGLQTHESRALTYTYTWWGSLFSKTIW